MRGAYCTLSQKLIVCSGGSSMNNPPITARCLRVLFIMLSTRSFTRLEKIVVGSSIQREERYPYNSCSHIARAGGEERDERITRKWSTRCLARKSQSRHYTPQSSDRSMVLKVAETCWFGSNRCKCSLGAIIGQHVMPTKPRLNRCAMVIPGSARS